MQINAKKSLGQNFLKDENVLNKIVNSVIVDKDDLIIEIGPGKGALTKHLKEFNCDVLCFEVDNRLIDILKEYEDDKLKVIYQDFLTIDDSIWNFNKYNHIHVIANIPYYITSPIINKIITLGFIDDATLMVQKEVALRITADPGCRAYGAFTVLTNVFYDTISLFDVSKNCFDPIPNVDSSVIQLSKKSDITILDKSFFTKFVYDCFSMKRKKLKNNLSMYKWDEILKILIQNNFDENVRAEEMPVELFVKISNYLSSK